HHMKYHMVTTHGLGQKLVCQICKTYTCANNSMLNSHMKSHSEVRSHACQTCGASYKFSYKLKQHLLKH
ncbi:hypothetical protein HELRODRAFT_128539, partial [Helobdella robusta]|uniref:C2H2-type domain-containing protein n=1 Tax=Helobdella robusta TaxID=6412 RepID=T1EHN6_HELRO